MINLLVVTEKKENFAGLETGLREHIEVQTAYAVTPDDALDKVSGQKIDLVVADETVAGTTGLNLVGKMVKANPLANYAAVSRLGHEDFHEKSEGLGILMQLTPNPDVEQGRQLFGCLSKVMSLMAKVRA